MMNALREYGPAPGAKKMLDWEKEAAENAMQSGMGRFNSHACLKKKFCTTINRCRRRPRPFVSLPSMISSAGVYVTWTSRVKGSLNGQECTRIGPNSLCFCGHRYSGHSINLGKNSFPCASGGCTCRRFEYMPSRPEECGEWWLVRRKNFDVSTYRASCKCKHNHLQHDPRSYRCNACPCPRFNSAFLCVACDGHSEDHETVWETKQVGRVRDHDHDGGSFWCIICNPLLARSRQLFYMPWFLHLCPRPPSLARCP